MFTKKKWISLKFLTAVMLFSNSLFSQNNVSSGTLIDKVNHNRFFLDEQKEHLICSNEMGEILWKTKSVADCSEMLIFGRFEKMKIVGISLHLAQNQTRQEEIMVRYSDNSCYFLDTITGKKIRNWRN